MKSEIVLEPFMSGYSYRDLDNGTIDAHVSPAAKKVHFSFNHIKQEEREDGDRATMTITCAHKMSMEFLLNWRVYDCYKVRLLYD